MASFATPTELATYLRTATEDEATGGNPDVLDTAVAQLLLDNASAAIRAVCGWNITTETVTAERVSSWSVGYFLLPTKRLTALALTVDGVTATDYTWTEAGVVTWGTLYVPTTATVLATYTHGYPTAPQGVREICLEQAAAKYVNPTRLSSTTIGETSEVYGFRFGSSPDDLPKDPRLSPYRLAGVA